MVGRYFDKWIEIERGVSFGVPVTSRIFVFWGRFPVDEVSYFLVVGCVYFLFLSRSLDR